ncbi:MAG: Bax inhibitor-1/YccA family protein [Nitrospirae bacterium]|nr:Bax inhibitor-1/YccA family protein [Nitrospirota bacterium]
MRTSNPVLSVKTFANVRGNYDSVMTVQGTATKSIILLLLLVISSSFVWKMFMESTDSSVVGPWMIGGAIGGFIVALVTMFKKEWSMFTAPVYAILEGLFIGGISATFEAKFSGIVFQAVTLTFGTLFCLLIAYKTRLITVSEKFKLGVVAATGAIGIFYLLSMVLGMFGVNMPFINGSGGFSIAISLFIVVIAALNLVLDFDFIETAAEQGAPQYMEWYGAFGLMVTLVWLYIEILRLLSKLQSRD